LEKCKELQWPEHEIIAEAIGEVVRMLVRKLDSERAVVAM
jgi:hypothetical protein